MESQHWSEEIWSSKQGSSLGCFASFSLRAALGLTLGRPSLSQIVVGSQSRKKGAELESLGWAMGAAAESAKLH